MKLLDVRRQRIALERWIAVAPLSFSPVRDPLVERAALPSMIGLYWSLVDGRGLPPMQAAFAAAVADHPRAARLPREAVIARACRTYPSLVRQQHFEHLLKERFQFVFRGHEMDFAGIDLLILENQRGYGVGLSLETAAGRIWHAAKARRHGRLPVPTLDLFAGPGRYVIGRYWLHPPEDVERVAAFIAREEALDCA